MVDEKKNKKAKSGKSDSKNTKNKKSKKSETMLIAAESDIAMDFATKVYKKFDKIIKSIVLFGSSAKRVSTSDSDIDIVIILDDISLKWDQELVAWYREELGKIIKQNPYRKSLHVNTVKLSTWWEDLIKGDPIVVNIIRYGEPMIDSGGFFAPLKILLQEGSIKSTPEAIYTLLQRSPNHMARARNSLLAAIDGLYWAMVDAAHAALIAGKISPPSPEHIPLILKETFVDNKILDSKYVEDYRDLHFIAKDIVHGKKIEISGKNIDDWIKKTDEFVGEMAQLVDKLIEDKKA
jgi:predicted nucleotidyltransferase/uncharacterized protein (UPF0332 family)